ncbi:DUF350 domain-containing protein [Aquimarina rhabdastrellae]
MELITTYFHWEDILHSLSYIVLASVIFGIGKIVYQMIHKNIKVNHELVEKDNLAFSFTYIGYFAGLLIVIGAAIVGESYGWIEDLITIGYYSILGVILLNISVWVMNKFLTTAFEIKKEIIDDQNVGTGVIEGGIYIATALILFGAITGESGGGYLHGTITAVGYWAIGMVIMIFTSKLYAKFVGYDIHAEIEKDNIAAGVAITGAIIAISIIIMNALLGDFEDWITTVIEIVIEVLLGLMILPLMRVVADKILLPGQRLTDEIVNQEKPNVGAALIEAFAYIGSAILITWSL